VKGYDFSALAGFGRDHILTRLARGGAKELGFPLLSYDSPLSGSSSPFLDQKSIANVVAAQNPNLPPPSDEALYVIAGQQPGLLTGPLYTFLKAVGCITLALSLSEKWDRTVLPLFWIASEDHDVLEVNRVNINSKRFVYQYPEQIKRGAVPQVGDISLEGAQEPLLAFLDENLPNTKFTPWIEDLVASMDFSNYATAFEGMMSALFSEWSLRFVSPAALRPFTGPVLAALVRKWPDVRLAFIKGGGHLESSGFNSPLKSCGFFEVSDSGRIAAEFLENSVRLEKGEYSFDEAADLVLAHPEKYSPNAALRPILQDAVLPVAATLGGPTELLYLWQIQPIYSVVDVIPSAVHPRPLATFIEDKILKAVEKIGLGADRIFEAGTALNDLLSGDDEDPEIDELKMKAKAFLSAVDTASLKSDNSRKRLKKSRDSADTILNKVIRQIKEQKLEEAGLARSRFNKIENALYPNNKPQERYANVLQFLNLYGPDFVKRAVESIDPLLMKHQGVFISAGSKEKGIK